MDWLRGWVNPPTIVTALAVLLRSDYRSIYATMRTRDTARLALYILQTEHSRPTWFPIASSGFLDRWLLIRTLLFPHDNSSTPITVTLKGHLLSQVSSRDCHIVSDPDLADNLSASIDRDIVANGQIRALYADRNLLPNTTIFANAFSIYECAIAVRHKEPGRASSSIRYATTPLAGKDQKHSPGSPYESKKHYKIRYPRHKGDKLQDPLERISCLQCAPPHAAGAGAQQTDRLGQIMPRFGEEH